MKHGRRSRSWRNLLFYRFFYKSFGIRDNRRIMNNRMLISNGNNGFDNTDGMTFIFDLCIQSVRVIDGGFFRVGVSPLTRNFLFLLFEIKRLRSFLFL